MRPSRYIEIDIISFCNLRCPSCLVSSSRREKHPSWPRGLMTVDLLGRILDKAVSEFDVPGVCLYMYSDPLLHPQLPELIDCVHQRNLKCLLSTNLNKLHDATALMRARPDWLRVSVSGFTQDVYARGHAGGDIEKVKANLKRLAAARDETGSPTEMDVFYIRYRDNGGDEEAAMEEFARQLGYKFVTSWSNISPVERILELHDAKTPPNAEDTQLLSRMAVNLHEALSLTSRNPSPTCWLQDNYLAMDVEGNVILCCAVSHRDANILGNYLDLSRSAILDAQSKHPLCRPCMKLGVPDFYKMELPELEAMGQRSRAEP